MCDQSMPYEPGTWVWNKQNGARKLWWPGKVVSLADTPDDFREYLEFNKRRYIAVVYFESEKTHEVVYNIAQIALYNCSDKSKHVEKGYSWYKQQLEQKTDTFRNYHMEHFIKDVKKAEECTGGDLHIFDRIEMELNKQNTDKLLKKSSIKELFVKNDKKKNDKKILSPMKSSIVRQDLNKSTSKSKASVEMISGVYVCYVKPCTQKFSSYDIFKRHVNSHKDEAKDACSSNQCPQVSKSAASTSGKSTTKNKSHTPKKQLNSKNRKSVAKKVKLEDELLKDWDEDDDLDESVNSDISSNLGTNLETSKAPTSAVASTYNTEVPKTLISAEASTSNTIFDFDENDDVSSVDIVSDLRHIKSSKQLLENSGSTLDQINNLEKSFCDSNKRENKTDLKNDKILFENMDTSNREVSSSSQKGLIMNVLDGIPTPDFNKCLSYKGLDEATRKFAIGDLEAFLPTEDNLESGVNPDPFESFKPSFFTEVVLDSPKEGFERREIWVPNKTDDKILPDEELLKLPFIQKVRALIASGQGDKVQLTISGAKLICKD